MSVGDLVRCEAIEAKILSLSNILEMAISSICAATAEEGELLLVLEDGLRKGFGPRDQVLRDLVRNHTDIVKPAFAPGMS